MHMDIGEGVVRSDKIGHFLTCHHKVHTTSRRCSPIQICVIEFDMDIGQPIVPISAPILECTYRSMYHNIMWTLGGLCDK